MSCRNVFFYALMAWALLGMDAKASLDAFVAPGASLVNADYTLIGEDGFNYAGSCVAPAGDVDGDGFGDVLVGAYGNEDAAVMAGKAYIFSGAALFASSDTDLSLADADYAFLGENGGDYAGSVVASAGDVDGDGLDDILITAWSNDDGGSAAGKVYVIMGASLSSGATDLSGADYSLVGENAGDWAGFSAAGAGDVDGDGLDDILVGAFRNADIGRDAGKAYLMLGSSLAASSSATLDLSSADYAFYGENRGDYAGYSVASAGDVDGDGLADILIGAEANGDAGTDAGKVYLFLGSSLKSVGASSMSLSKADYTFTGETYGNWAGSSIASAGDVDKDGYSDLIIGAWGNSDGGSYYSGKAYVVLGASILASTSTEISLSDADYSMIGEDAGDRAGSSVASAGDVDGDGASDLIVGAVTRDEHSTDDGKAYVVLASSLMASSGAGLDLADADYQFVGEASQDAAGCSVVGAGDMDGDGLSELLIGAYGNDDGGTTAGKVYVVESSNRCDVSSAVYVDVEHGASGADGGFSCPVLTIAEGIALAKTKSVTNVYVRGGYYPETVHMAYGINLLGVWQEVDGADMVPVIVNTNMSDYVVYGAGSCAMKFFGVLDGGIYLNGVEKMKLQENWVLNRTSEVACVTIDQQSMNNTMCNNLLINWVKTTDAPALKIGDYASSNYLINNAMHRRGVAGLKVMTATVVYMTKYAGALGNNIFYNNILYAGEVTKLSMPKRGFYAESSSVGCTIQYNYTLPTNINVTVSTFTNIKGTTPEFMDPYSGGVNYKLDWKAPSPCIDKGSSAIAYKDQDGTRNDMGCYGGPNSFDQK